MNLGFSETAFLVVLGLLLFGPKKLPEIGRQIGRIMAEFKRASAEFQNQLNDEVRQLEQEIDQQKQTILPPQGVTAREPATLSLSADPQSAASQDHDGDTSLDNATGDETNELSRVVTQGPNA